MVDVVVVGSGPNGLAAAVTLVRAGLHVRVVEAEATAGGGARTLPLGTDWLVVRRGVDAEQIAALPHDVCSTTHPLALASPFLRGFDLAARGVQLVSPRVSYAHPLPGGAVLAHRSLEQTVAELGPDGAAWRRSVGSLAERPDALAGLLLGDRRAALGGPGQARAAAALANALVRAPREGRAGALLAGVAAHAMAPLSSPAATGTGLLLGALAHAGGWPVPVGGSRAIVDALLTDLRAHGVEVETGRRVRSWGDLPAGADVLLTTSVPRALGIVGHRVPWHVRAALRRFRSGPGASAVQLVLDGPVPWADARAREAGTVHVAGSVDDVRAAQAAVRAGRHAERPVVLLGDPTPWDPARFGSARPTARVVWAYAHVPAGSGRDVTDDVLAHVERYAPDVRDRVLATRCVPAAHLSAHDENLLGGDIATGAVTAWQMLARPRLAPDPHLLGEVGGRLVLLGSAASPPGPGVHGMGGYLAARSLLARRGVRPGALGPRG
ncbi:phytoene desaturase family protein [Sanguibacter sp. A247]|uniref:phytoene desaturase family protein n=1 Tax=unclassified Sanguibacter TaxID=2645534 RepID=UPI003FD7D411